MGLGQLLEQKKTAILQKWLSLILETYPADSARFLEREKDRFTNPVGSTIVQATREIYDGLLCGNPPDKMTASLDSIIRIRAVQDFPPSVAISFTLFLKKAVREVLSQEFLQGQTFSELLQFESRIDELTLLAFDIYTRCREQIFEIRLSEVKAQRETALKVLERAGEKCDPLDDDADYSR